MTQYNTLNVKLSNLQLNKLILKYLYSNIIGDSNNKNNFLHKLLLTNTQVSKLRKVFSNGSLAIKLSKTQMHKIGQWRISR